jgi:hypothetical protein
MYALSGKSTDTSARSDMDCMLSPGLLPPPLEH